MSAIVTLKQVIKEIRSIVCTTYYNEKWKKFCKTNDRGINDIKRDVPIIITLTSFPGRINTVLATIHSLLMQETKPDQIELWLADSEFKDKEKDLPVELVNLKKYGLEIRWCENLYSYKKLVPSYRTHTDCIFVTADDDVFYSSKWLRKLYDAYQQHPKDVCCHKATQFYYAQGRLLHIGGGRRFYKVSSYLNKLVGVGGVLYPPGALYNDVTNVEKFMKCAPTNDDIWFWFMAIKNGKKIRVVDNADPKPIDVYERKKSEKLTDKNDKGPNLFETQLKNMLEEYPEVEGMLREEYQRYQRSLS